MVKWLSRLAQSRYVKYVGMQFNYRGYEILAKVGVVIFDCTLNWEVLKTVISLFPVILVWKIMGKYLKAVTNIKPVIFFKHHKSQKPVIP